MILLQQNEPCPNAEAKLRLWAEIFPNAYIVGIFACCRQLYDPAKMTGCLPTAKAMQMDSTEYLVKELQSLKKQLVNMRQTQIKQMKKQLEEEK